MFSVPVYVISIRYVSNVEILFSPFFSLALLVNMLGALLPDVDWQVVRIWSGFGHRNPLTHSGIIPVAAHVLSAGCILSPPQGIYVHAFALGVLTHLLGDLSGTGNLVWIPRRFEERWLALNCLFLLVLLLLTDFVKRGPVVHI